MLLCCRWLLCVFTFLYFVFLYFSKIHLPPSPNPSISTLIFVVFVFFSLFSLLFLSTTPFHPFFVFLSLSLSLSLFLFLVVIIISLLGFPFLSGVPQHLKCTKDSTLCRALHSIHPEGCGNGQDIAPPLLIIRNTCKFERL